MNNERGRKEPVERKRQGITPPMAPKKKAKGITQADWEALGRDLGASWKALAVSVEEAMRIISRDQKKPTKRRIAEARDKIQRKQHRETLQRARQLMGNDER